MPAGLDLIATLAIALAASTPDGPGAANPPKQGEVVAGRTAGFPAFRFEPTGLSLLRPYERGKIPVVLVHGLWGSPIQWTAMVRVLESDEDLRGRFQLWTFGYSTGDPIPYSAHLLREALGEARRRFDPDGTDAALERMVVVGHSMGGLLAKMMAQHTQARLWDLHATRPPEQLAGRPEERELFRRAMLFGPIPGVRRVVFIATPHRGAKLDSGPIHRIGTRLVRQLDPLRATHASLLKRNGPEFFTPLFRAGLPTSVDQLEWDHPLLVEIGRLAYGDGVKLHSIIADRRDPPQAGGDDGIVPYESAHLDGVASERLVHAGHLCLDDPHVAREVVRILAEHARE